MHHLSLKSMRFKRIAQESPAFDAATLTKQLRMMERKRPDCQNRVQSNPSEGGITLSELGGAIQLVLDAIRNGATRI
jgi:DNA-binding HxlR family transcriptional regulator